MPQKGSYEHRAQSLEDRRGEVVAPFVGPESRLQSKRFACSFEHLSKCWSTSTQKVHVNTYIGGLYQATLVGMDMPPIHPPYPPHPSTLPTYLPCLPYLPTPPAITTIQWGMWGWDMGGRHGTWGAGPGPGLLSRALQPLQPLQPRTRYPTPENGSHTARSPREILLPYGDVGVLSDLGFFYGLGSH